MMKFALMEKQTVVLLFYQVVDVYVTTKITYVPSKVSTTQSLKSYLTLFQNFSQLKNMA